MKEKEIKSFFKLIVSLFICYAAGWIGSFFTRQSVSGWYASINKPFFNPPNWIFAPVWTMLYTLMGIALFLVWSKGLQEIAVRKAIKVFMVQLVFNSLWSIVFFGSHSIVGGFLVVLILWGAILSTILHFLPLSKWAAILLIPYLVWVSFAAILNGTLIFLN